MLIVSAFILLNLIASSSILAQLSSGPKDAGTGSNVNGPGTIAWTNPGNLAAAGSATSDLTTNATSEYLQGTNYGFAIPTGSTITGIEVTINRSSSSNAGGNSVNDVDLYLLKSGVTVGSNKAVATDWPISLAEATYGGSNDLWGTTWTPAEINASNFGVSLSVLNQSGFGNRIASVDYMQVKVYYYPPGTQTYTSNNTYTVPAGVYAITVQAWGGGGGGNNGGGKEGGGGGGAFATKTFSVTPGTMYAVTVGSGGGPGNNGSSSSFGTEVIAVGGSGGNNDNGSAGGQASLCTPTFGAFSGGAGGNAASGAGNNGGGGGGGSAFANNVGGNGTNGSGDNGGAGGIGQGNGGNGGNQDVTNAQNGIAPGGGGGGKGSNTTSGTGAAG